MASVISFIRQEDYNTAGVRRAVRRTVDLLGGIGRFVRDGERILLKPNLLSPSAPEEAITTHPAVVKAAIDLVREAGGKPVIGDSPGMASLTKAAERAGILEVARRAGVELLDFDQPQELKVLPGFRYKRIEVAQGALEVDGIINLPKLKTHGQMTLTLGVKNMFGCVPGKRKAQWHLQAGRSREAFGEMLVELYAAMKPRLTIVDGILGMEGDGPGTSGSPRWLDVVAASSDAHALDMMIASLLGIPIASVPTIQVAQEKGLLPPDTNTFQIAGDSPDDLRPPGFVPPASMDLSWGMPPLLHRALRGALTARPWIEPSLCGLCHICSDACPSEAIREDGRGMRIDEQKCIRCFCCQELCPEGAVKTRQGWAARWLGIKG